MKHALVLVAGLVGLASSRSEASCISVVQACFCGRGSGGAVGIVVTEAIDGGTASVRVESGQVGLDAGAAFPISAEPNETAGSRWLFLGGERQAIDAQGSVVCEFTTTRLAAADVATAAAGSTCEADISALGFQEPRCNDTGGCTVSPLMLLPLLGLALLRRRQR